MAKKKVGNKKEKKEKFLVNLKDLFNKYKQIAVCTLTNVGSL